MHTRLHPSPHPFYPKPKNASLPKPPTRKDLAAIGLTTGNTTSNNPLLHSPQSARDLTPDEAIEKVKEGVEAESFLRLHVVQAKRDDATAGPA